MSVDAMIASQGRGAAQARPDFRKALGTGMAFQAFDHWIAFGLLGAMVALILHDHLTAG